MRKIRLPLLLATLVLVFAGCRQEPIRTYRIAKEKSPAALPSGTSELAPSAPGITWGAPTEWEARPPTAVRVGNYSVPDPVGGQAADFAITTFPGDVGGDLANVNRWRQQIGLSGIADEELPSQLRRITAPAGEFLIVNFANPETGIRVISAIFKQPGKSWFFKLAGTDTLVAGQEEAFTALLQSVRFGEGLVPPIGIVSSSMAAANTNDLPPGHPPIGGMPNVAATPADAPTSTNALRWAAPDHWIPKELAPLRKASYTVHSADHRAADFSIISLPGDAGGIHENVNRWRGQIGLAPLGAAAIDNSLRHIDSGSLHFDFVEFASEGPEAERVLGAFLFHGGDTWFFKMAGPDTMVATERETFLKFIGTVRAR